jgi:hypothetical protein
VSIRRWTFDGPPAYPYENGGYVTYDDHAAALAELGAQHNLQLELLHGVIQSEQERCEREHASGRATARDAVAAVPDAVDEIGGYSFDEAITMALAAIDAPCDCGTCRAIAADRIERQSRKSGGRDD